MFHSPLEIPGMQIVIFRGIESAPNFTTNVTTNHIQGQHMEPVVTISPVFSCHCRWSFPEGRHDTRLEAITNNGRQTRS